MVGFVGLGEVPVSLREEVAEIRRGGVAGDLEVDAASLRWSGLNGHGHGHDKEKATVTKYEMVIGAYEMVIRALTKT